MPTPFLAASAYGKTMDLAGLRADSSARKHPALSQKREQYETQNVEEPIMKNKTAMQLGMIGLGRMGANMVRRLIRGGHQCVVYDRTPQTVKELVKEQAGDANSLAELVKKLAEPRAVWLMVPAAVVDQTIAELVP